MIVDVKKSGTLLCDDIINPKIARKPKTYEATGEGRIVICPSLHQIKERGKLRRILKRLIHIKKGH